jgi:hypothetical protein
MMHSSHMAVQVRPPQARHIAVPVGTIVSEEQDRILHYFVTLISDAVIVIRESYIDVREVLVSFRSIVCEDDKLRRCLFC